MAANADYGAGQAEPSDYRFSDCSCKTVYDFEAALREILRIADDVSIGSPNALARIGQIANMVLVDNDYLPPTDGSVTS